MLHCGHSREALIQQGTAHTRRGVQSCRTRQQGLNAKLKMGWEPPGSHPIRYVVCSRISQLWPLNSACPSTLSSVASCPSPCVCLSPCSLRQSPTHRPFVKLASSAVPRVFTIRFIRKTDVCPLTPHPSCPYIDPTFVGACPQLSGTSTSRSSAAPVIHRNGTRTL